MFGVSAFINYTIAVAVWTRFCFHVFLMWSCANCGAFLSGICILGLDWQVRRWTTQMDQSKASPTILPAAYVTPRISMKEEDMAQASKSQRDKIEHPQAHYETPDDLIKDQNLSPGEKKKALNVWEQDARQWLTASNEGMSGSEEGVNQRNHHQLGQVERARDKMVAKPKRKKSH